MQYTRPTWDNTWKDFLEILAKRSTCLKYHTSALLVINQDTVFSMGYNGTFSKAVECADYWFNVYNERQIKISFDEWCKTEEFRDEHRLWAISHEVHAEANALTWLNKGHPDLNKMTLYTKLSPCDECAKLIISYGIKKVKYVEQYPRGDKAIRRMCQNKISVEQITG